MSIAESVDAIIRGGIAVPAKAAGFRKTGSNFYRRNGDVVQVINAQISSALTPSRTLYINVGLAFDALWQLAKRAIVDRPKVWECHFYRRLDNLIPTVPPSWSITAETCVELVLDELSPAVLSLLSKLDSIDSPASFLESGWVTHGDSLELAARLKYVLGDMTAASEYLHAAAAEFADRMNSTPADLAKRLQLTGLV